jgi:queuine tRNA-ribosyltransferase
MADEMLGPRLNTIHNLHYYMDLIELIRAAILEGRLENLSLQAAGGEQGPEERA